MLRWADATRVASLQRAAISFGASPFTGKPEDRRVLWLRSLLWTILLPGVVAGYLPWAVFGLDRVRWEWNAGFLAGVLIVAPGRRCLGLRCGVARSGRARFRPSILRATCRSRPLSIRAQPDVLERDGDSPRRGAADPLASAGDRLGGLVCGRKRSSSPTSRRGHSAIVAEYAARVGRWLPSWPTPTGERDPPSGFRVPIPEFTGLVPFHGASLT